MYPHSNIKAAAGCRPRPGFTLIEIMVVVAILALLTILTLPSIRSMQAGNARAQAYNTINAALQAARSYAIMNGINTAARFQPNGKIFIVYRFDNNRGTGPCGARTWNGAAINNYPSAPGAGGQPNPNGYIYLPVINQEPLVMPRGYACANANTEATRLPFYEPFYVCYRSDGTTAVDEQIWVALIDITSTAWDPVSPNFNTQDIRTAWSVDINTGFSGTDWLTFSEDPVNIQDPVDRALARFYNVARGGTYIALFTEIEEKVNETLGEKDPDYGPDHFAGAYIAGGYTPFGYLNAINPTLVFSTSTTQIAIFKTPDNWDQMPLFLADNTKTNTKQQYVDNNTTGVLAENTAGVQTRSGSFDRLYINPYTGRVIRPVE